jgi:hypothetical protein
MSSSTKAKATLIVSNLIANGCTNISGALALAFHELDKYKEDLSKQGRVVRTILFTDGCPTAGNCNYDDLIHLASRVPLGQITSMGYGKHQLHGIYVVDPPKPNSDFYSSQATNINQNNDLNNLPITWCSSSVTNITMTGMSGEIDVSLLQNISQAGKGNFYYMEDPDTCVRAFAYELAGLLTTVGQNISIKIQPTAHISIQEIMDDVDCKDSGNSAVISLTDIMAEERKFLLLKIKIKKQNKSFPRETHIATVVLDYQNQNGEQVIDEYRIKVYFVQSGKETKDQHKEVKAHLALLSVINAQKQVEIDASNGVFRGTSYSNYISSVSNLDSADLSDTHVELYKAMHSNNVSNYVDSTAFSSSSVTRKTTQYSTLTGRSAGINHQDIKGTVNQDSMVNSFADTSDSEINTVTPVNTSTCGFSKKSSIPKF